jgi:hypothetical protein
MKAVPASFLAAILAAAPVLAAETAGTTTQTPPAATAHKAPTSEPQKMAGAKKPATHHRRHATHKHGTTSSATAPAPTPAK